MVPFQARLWTIVGIFLTGITVAGLLGIPYYIKSEVDLRLQSSTAEFSRRSSDLLAHAKLLTSLYARHHHAVGNVQVTMYKLADALEAHILKNKDTAPRDVGTFRIEELRRELLALASRDDFSSVAQDGNINHRLSVEDDFAEQDLLPAKIISLENNSPTGSSMARFTHPVQDGTCGGAIKDIKYQISVVIALQRSIEEVERRILELGGQTSTDKRLESARVLSLETELLKPSFDSALAKVEKSFMTKEEREEFDPVRKLYTQNYSRQ